MKIRDNVSDIVDKLSVVVYRCEQPPAWRLQYVSGGCRQLMGESPESLMRHSESGIDQFVFPDDRAQVVQDISQGLATNGCYEIQYRVVTHAGELRWVWDKGRGVYEGECIVAIEGFISDVSGKVLTEQRYLAHQVKLGADLDQQLELAEKRNLELQKALADYQSIDERRLAFVKRLQTYQNTVLKIATSASVINGDIQQASCLISQLLAETLGVQRASIWLYDSHFNALSLQNLYEIEKNQHSGSIIIQQKDYPIYFQALENGRVIVVDKVDRNTVLAEFHDSLQALGIGATLNAIVRTSGELRGVVTVDNIGGSRRWEADEISFLGEIADQVSLLLLNHANKVSEQEAAEARVESRAKSEFLAIMSHEIRTPLNGVLGIAELLQGMDLTDKQLHYVNTIHHSGTLLLDILNDVLDFSRINAGRMTIEEVEFDLESLVDGCVDIFSSQSSEKRLPFVASVEIGTPTRLKGDPSRLRQVLINLLSNAFKFTEKGEVVLHVSHEPSDDDQIELVFTITDSGIGMSEDQQKKLFKPFSQANRSTSRKYGGTGLGLAICKQLVEMMGGQISLASKEKVGSCFTFSARVSPGDISECYCQTLPSDMFKGKSLLIVDSHLLFADLVCEMAQAIGIQARRCLTLAEANAALDDDLAPDFLLLSDNLTDGDWQELLNKGESTPGLSGAVILLKETQTQSEVLALNRHCDINLVLEKPMSTSLVRRVITNIAGFGSAENLRELRMPGKPLLLETLKVLVVEDNPVNRMVIKGLLGNLGIKPDLVENGRLAVSRVKASEQAYDLILMDCEMPEVDGYEATRQIRKFEKDSATARALIVAVTAHAVKAFRDRAFECGMDAYLSKPIDTLTLEKMLRVHFCQ